MNDPLYFPRTALAEKLLISLKDGITNALTLFAPRRMGKTQFLIRDIKPKAEKMGFNVFYFSFMDQIGDNIQTAFNHALIEFLTKTAKGTSKLFDTLKNIKGLDVLGVGFELEDKQEAEFISINRIISELAEKSEKPVLMLLDEVQELARIKGTEAMIKSLRTGLDINQNRIKVIFTGSSTNGLRAMFNDNKAPFFHFAHALDFPNLGREFTDFLADVYHRRTQNQIDKEKFYRVFQRFHYTPLYLRAITQDMILNPDLTLEQAAQYRAEQMEEHSESGQLWQSLSELERLILLTILNGSTNLYSKETRQEIANKLGIEVISSSVLQGKLRKLERNEVVTRAADNTLKLNNPHFETWIRENALS